ncbi:MAG: GNAT family N-acetyltransferase [Actinobacteria bacterium]|nr:GNAT family N-acetyltransferase [Actinomycetota bacterium]
MVTLAELPTLVCPWCGFAVPKDTPWAISAATVWGWCGVKLTVDDEVAGVLLLAPLEEPGHARVMAVWVRPGSTGAGYGRQLVQAAAAGLVARKARVIEARGSRTGVRCEAPPHEFLRAVGFTRGRDDRLWRLDLDRAVLGERNGVRNVFERFWESLRPVVPPEPAGGAISGRVHRS